MRSLISILLMVFITPSLFTAEDKPSAAEIKKRVEEANVILDVVAKDGIKMSEKAYQDIIPLLQEKGLNLPLFVQPSSKAVQTAETRYTEELIELREEYLKAVMKAQEKYASVLDREIKREERKNNWAEALTLQIKKSDILNEKGIKTDFLGNPIAPETNSTTPSLVGTWLLNNDPNQQRIFSKEGKAPQGSWKILSNESVEWIANGKSHILTYDVKEEVWKGIRKPDGFKFTLNPLKE